MLLLNQTRLLCDCFHYLRGHNFISVSFRFVLLLCCIAEISFSQQLKSFDTETHYPAPDYSLQQNWSALPFRTDAADKVPKGETWIHDSLKKVDVFYIHPTMYGKGMHWNASVNDEKINRKVDNKPVRFQATVFNESCRVYAPRYRQAIVDVFYKTTTDGEKALNLAYEDVKTAFEYYLKNYNNGRPFIIASHSQGTCHSRRLLKEYFDGKPLSKQLIAAYAIGYTINDSMYTTLKMCNSATETGCYISWLSYKAGYEPTGNFSKYAQSINPVSWTQNRDLIDKEKGLGTMGAKFGSKFLNRTAAQIHDNGSGGSILWVHTTVPLLRLLKNMHIIDYNLFWYDIRHNVKQRIEAFDRKH